ncbi:c2-set_2 domain-containing protein [Nephila pilipes]|uniref:C2-set_2 domain-containing protein n=1 Tax=Nephila pilipes TaxID=299642 RepID=A0A8X6T7G5_NEPPI|nr:c2-set_2 domain-containing protein [Nephila pilipes]
MLINIIETRIYCFFIDDSKSHKYRKSYPYKYPINVEELRHGKLVKPKPPDLYVDGRPVQNATTLGPYTEGSTFILDCRSSGGRPPPLITLWNGTRTLSAKSHVETTEDGASDVIVTARFVLSRWDLESRLECRVQSNATLAPMVKWIKLDIHGKCPFYEFTVLSSILF